MIDTNFSMLLADADAYLAEVTAKFLGAHGVRIKVLTDGSLIERELEWSDYGCLVAATNLGEGTGIDICKRVREKHAVLPIVVTGTGIPNERVRALLAGADDYVRRPYSSRDLIERIVTIMRRRRSTYPLFRAR